MAPLTDQFVRLVGTNPVVQGFVGGLVISDEILPETHSRGYERVATLGTMVGVVVMLYLDVTLG